MAYVTTTEADKIIAEFWISEVIARLRAAIVLTPLVWRDFSKTTQNKGDIINIPKRGTVTVRTKAENTDITSDTPTNDSVAVTLDTHKYVSWAIEDRASALAIDRGLQYLDDAVPQLVEFIEADILAEYANVGSSIGTAGVDIDGATVLEARKALNDANVPMMGRAMVVSTKDEIALLGIDKFTDATQRVDGGAALKEATIGRLYGFDVYMSQLVVESGAAPVNTHNLAFHPQGLVLATRPLPNNSGKGVLQTVVTDPVSGLSLRFSQGYSIAAMATINTVDILYGIKTVDANKTLEILS